MKCTVCGKPKIFIGINLRSKARMCKACYKGKSSLCGSWLADIECKQIIAMRKERS